MLSVKQSSYHELSVGIHRCVLFTVQVHHLVDHLIDLFSFILFIHLFIFVKYVYI